MLIKKEMLLFDLSSDLESIQTLYSRKRGIGLPTDKGIIKIDLTALKAQSLRFMDGDSIGELKWKLLEISDRIFLDRSVFIDFGLCVFSRVFSNFVDLTSNLNFDNVFKLID